MVAIRDRYETQATTDFNAIRISIASPDQIRSWSHGEVTKPETINYRTLRPEKDGLFCERIFGPTKDWECFCGKYKRIRYRGVICDRCGVEVTRAKVRRERMGHVSLAAPVAHIWFSKTTPSRLGLLLDLSPRDLERVLYFAQYIVTYVDDEARQQAVEEEQDSHNVEVSRLRQEVESAKAVIFGQDGNGSNGDLDGLLDDNASISSADDPAQDEPALTPEAEAEAARLDGELQQREVALGKELEERVDELKTLRKHRLLSDSRFRELKARYGDVFQARMGAEGILDILRTTDLEELREVLHGEMRSSSGQRRKKAIKRLKVIESFRKSNNKPDWMILEVLPVLPPELRPMVQLDGGRFATSDLNDLYRRVINRNNRLRRLLQLGAPDIIVRNEKRMLQEAVDALIDNGRRGRPIQGSHNHKLKSLSDLLRGKQGRFRQNLLGKRVDYSGRSVIVVGPELQMHQCGLPKRMALELFKPFVMHRLVVLGISPNIKSAKRMVERSRPEVWDILEEVVRDRPVLLNRAPTLHRLGIQAFMPVLIEGSAIQIHPLVCSAFNADFDGDQMAVHVPLSGMAVEEAKNTMLSVHNMLSPASGEPLVAPTLDMVLGCYYLTKERPEAKGSGMRFADYEEAQAASDAGHLDLQAEILVRDSEEATGWVTTTLGRMALNRVLPPEVEPRNRVMDRNELKELTSEFYRKLDHLDAAAALDRIKTLGFHYASTSGITIGMNDIQVPMRKQTVIAEANRRVEEYEEQYMQGLTDEEQRYNDTVKAWTKASDRMERIVKKDMRVLNPDELIRDMRAAHRIDADHRESGNPTLIDEMREIIRDVGTSDLVNAVSEAQRRAERGDGEADLRFIAAMQEALPEAQRKEGDPSIAVGNYGGIEVMAVSGTKGNITQIKQMAGMRGLMSDPKGRIIDLPIKSSFREGLTALEYFISTHGARKGLADTALRTADSGYLTRRLIDVSQDVIILEEDCGTTEGVAISRRAEDPLLAPLEERLLGRTVALAIVHPETGEVLGDNGDEISEEMAGRIKEAGINQVTVRSPLTCEARRGLCEMCYGRIPATGRRVQRGEAVGIIAAQSIGEPGTQLTMRTFHTGGVASVSDITTGLPRVEELFEVRVPKGAAMLADIDGVATVDEPMEGRRLRITSREQYREDYEIPADVDVLVVEGEWVEEGMTLAKSVPPEPPDGDDQDTSPEPAALAEWTPMELRAGLSGRVEFGDGGLSVVYEDIEERDYPLPPSARVLVSTGSEVRAGDALTAGPLNPHDILRIRGSEELQRYLVEEVQKVYRSQGVSIHDKHIEVILRQMLRRVQVESPGDTEFIPGQTVDRFEFRAKNAMMLAEGGEPATAKPVLLGITRASLLTDSFLAAASFQETTRVLTEAVVSGARDRLLGLKENVIIGRLIPARVEAFKEKPLALDTDVQDAILPPDWLSEEMGYGGRRQNDGNDEFEPATTEDLTDQLFALPDSDDADDEPSKEGEDVTPL